MKLIVLSLIVLTLASCASGPETKTASQWARYLPEGSLIYGYMEAKSNTQFLQGLSKGNDTLEDLVRRTSKLYFSLDNTPGNTWDFRILALGDYPGGWLGFYLDWQKAFKKIVGPPAQWLFQKSFYIFQPENGAVLVDKAPLPEFKTNQGYSFPLNISQQMEKWDLFLYLPKPAKAISGGAFGAAIPLEEMTCYFRIGKDGWIGEVTANLTDEKAARFVNLGVKMLLGGWAKTAKTADEKSMYQKITFRQEGFRVILENITIPYSLVLEKLKPLLEDLS